MNRFCRAVGAVALLALLVAPVALGAAEPRKVVTIEGITEYALDNGLRVLLYPDNSTSRVTVNLTVLVGSRHEGYGETGMAHLLEHMLFKGTPTHPDVPKALRDHGGNFNGSTWVDRTNYFETMPASDDNLDFALRLEADRLLNSNVKREDLASEMTVVRNEFEQGENSPRAILSQRMMGVAYEWHNYGKSTIGNRSDIERVPIENLRAFYKKHYQPDNAVLIVAGNFDPDKALTLVGKYFGALKRPARKLDDTYTEEPAQDGERTVVLRRVGTVGVVGAVYHIPAGSHPDFAALEVLATMLTAQPSGRLYKALVESKKANSVSADASGYHDPGVLEVMATVSGEEQLDGVRDTMTGLLEGLAREKIAPEEVERARTKLLKGREQLMKDTNRIGVALSEWAAGGDWRLFFLHRDRLEKVTPEDVTRVAATYLQRSNRTVGLYVPMKAAARTPVPATPDVASLVKDYKGRATVAAGEAFDPTPQNIEKRTLRSELPGGVKLALLPKKSRGNAVTVDVTLHYGNADSLKGLTSASQLLAPLMARGTAKHSYQQLQDELDKLKISLSPGGVTGDVTFTVQCKRETLPRALELLGEVLREPAFPQQEFDVLKRQTREGLTQGLTEPTALAPRALRRKLSPYPADDVRYVPTVPESIERLDKVTLADVRKLYAEQLGGVAGEVVIVGDFDPEPAARQVADMLKDWKAGTAYKRIEQAANADVKGEVITIETPDKANAVYMAGLTVAMNDSDPDYPALVLANYVLGGAPLASRLSNRVRGKDGLSYGVGSMYAADSVDRLARLSIFAISNPTNTEKVRAAIADEMQKFHKDGLTEKELEEAKKAYLQSLKGRRATDGALASLLQENLYAGRTATYQADFEKQLAELTADKVNAAARKHVDAKRLVIVEAGDFKKK